MKTSSKRLLDTNIVIALFAGEPSVIAAVQECSEVFLPVTVLGELCYGVFRSTRRQQNLDRLKDFSQRVAVLACDADTAWHYGALKAALSARGRPIPENDIWIAALAVQHGLSVMTRDSHFKEVVNLRVDLIG